MSKQSKCLGVDEVFDRAIEILNQERFLGASDWIRRGTATYSKSVPAAMYRMRAIERAENIVQEKESQS